MARMEDNASNEYNGVEFSEADIQEAREEIMRDAARFRLTRMLVGASADDVADELDVRSTAVRRWESGVGYIPAAAWRLLERWKSEREELIVSMIERRDATGEVLVSRDSADAAYQRRFNAAAVAVYDEALIDGIEVRFAYADGVMPDNRNAALKSLWFKSRES